MDKSEIFHTEDGKEWKECSLEEWSTLSPYTREILCRTGEQLTKLYFVKLVTKGS